MTDSTTVDRIPEENDLEAVVATTDDQDVLQSLDELLDQVSNKFNKITTELNTKLDEMGQRLDDLEASIKARLDTDVDTNDGNPGA